MEDDLRTILLPMVATAITSMLLVVVVAAAGHRWD
jgi:hypothetical protein